MGLKNEKTIILTLFDNKNQYFPFKSKFSKI